MSWWNRRSKTGGHVRLPRVEAPKMGDPSCVACYLRNDSEVQLDFVSMLETHYPMLIEASAWKGFVLQPGEKKLVPHRYWDIFPRDVVRKVSIIEIPKDHEPVEFLYKTRATEQKGNGAVALHSQSEGSDTPSLDAAPLEKASPGTA